MEGDNFVYGVNVSAIKRQQEAVRQAKPPTPDEILAACEVIIRAGVKRSKLVKALRDVDEEGWFREQLEGEGF